MLETQMCTTRSYKVKRAPHTFRVLKVSRTGNYEAFLPEH